LVQQVQVVVVVYHLETLELLVKQVRNQAPTFSKNLMLQNAKPKYHKILVMIP